VGGLAGIIGFNSAPKPAIEEMVGALAHRGPDHMELFRDPVVHIGVCGLSSGKLIASNSDKTAICGFSGRLYNIPALTRRFLKGGLQGDCYPSEIVLHLYEKIGPELAEFLEGQFAFVLFDKHKGIVILARDPVGICPLYYAVTDDYFIFGSEVKAILKSCAVEVRPNIKALYENFVYWSTSGGRTIFQDIYQVPPACSAVVDWNKNIRIQQYRWRRDLNPGNKSSGKIKEEIYTTLTQAVLDCLGGEEKAGLYLSGGLDSSILLRLANELGYIDLPVFSLGFADSAVDESAYQTLAVEGHEGEHHRLLIRDRDIVEALPQVLRHCEIPLFKLGPVPMFLLSRVARQQGVRFILSGEGADELFYGYDLFKETKFRISWLENPDSGQDIVHIVPPQHKNNPYMVEMYRDYYSRYLEPREDTLYCMRPRIDTSSKIIEYFTPENRTLLNTTELDNIVTGQFSCNSSALKQCQEVQMQLLLPGYLLSAQGDRMLMANSVQGRFPFLHRPMIELSMSIPDSLKLKGYQEKYILKETFADILPPAIVRRGKYQYSCPGASILLSHEEIGAYLDKKTFEHMGIFDYNAFQSLLQTFGAGLGQQYLDLTEEMILTYIVTVHMLLALAKDGFA